MLKQAPYILRHKTLIAVSNLPQTCLKRWSMKLMCVIGLIQRLLIQPLHVPVFPQHWIRRITQTNGGRPSLKMMFRSKRSKSSGIMEMKASCSPSIWILPSMESCVHLFPGMLMFIQRKQIWWLKREHGQHISAMGMVLPSLLDKRSRSRNCRKIVLHDRRLYSFYVGLMF